jgi:nucleotide-binding universal stress UspA family protein
MKILLAVDGSPHSLEALDEVRQRPWPNGSRVRILSVVQPIVPPAADFAAGAAALPQELFDEQRRAAQRVVAQTERALRSTALTSEPFVREGDPKSEIVEEAIQWGADLIVMGSHGHSALERLLLGSVANSVINHSPCSVEVVRHPHRNAA